MCHSTSKPSKSGRLFAPCVYRHQMGCCSNHNVWCTQCTLYSILWYVQVPTIIIIIIYRCVCLCRICCNLSSPYTPQKRIKNLWMNRSYVWMNCGLAFSSRIPFTITTTTKILYTDCTHTHTHTVYGLEHALSCFVRLLALTRWCRGSKWMSEKWDRYADEVEKRDRSPCWWNINSWMKWMNEKLNGTFRFWGNQLNCFAHKKLWRYSTHTHIHVRKQHTTTTTTTKCYIKTRFHSNYSWFRFSDSGLGLSIYLDVCIDFHAILRFSFDLNLLFCFSRVFFLLLFQFRVSFCCSWNNSTTHVPQIAQAHREQCVPPLQNH